MAEINTDKTPAQQPLPADDAAKLAAGAWKDHAHEWFEPVPQPFTAEAAAKMTVESWKDHTLEWFEHVANGMIQMAAFGGANQCAIPIPNGIPWKILETKLLMLGYSVKPNPYDNVIILTWKVPTEWPYDSNSDGKQSSPRRRRRG
ncbi:MAG: hypothetical protein MJZ25_08760 [Fibrobacter sp.]|nr:hypothetical protein [Fibrobacter sp.]